MDIIFRELDEADCAAYRTLRMQALQEQPHAFTESVEDESWLTESDYKERLTTNDNHFSLGVFEESNLVAFIHFFRYKESQRRHMGEIKDLYVEPSYRSEEIGRDLLSDCMAHTADIPQLNFLNVTCSTDCTHALRLFEQAGFEVWGVETNAIQVDGKAKTQVHMRLELTAEALAKQA